MQAIQKDSFEETLEIPSVSSATHGVSETVLDALELSGWSKDADESAFSRIRLALEEALANAIKHGNQMRDDTEVTILYRVTSQRLHVEITDQGTGFNPAEVPDPTADENLERPCGRGIMLIRAFMSSVKFNEIGNCIIFTFERNEQG